MKKLKRAKKDTDPQDLILVLKMKVKKYKGTFLNNDVACGHVLLYQRGKNDAILH